MMNFAEEIYSRPKREWIVSQTQKVVIRENAKKSREEINN